MLITNKLLASKACAVLPELHVMCMQANMRLGVEYCTGQQRRCREFISDKGCVRPLCFLFCHCLQCTCFWVNVFAGNQNTQLQGYDIEADTASSRPKNGQYCCSHESAVAACPTVGHDNFCYSVKCLCRTGAAGRACNGAHRARGWQGDGLRSPSPDARLF
jgi:hypothetical protein